MYLFTIHGSLTRFVLTFVVARLPLCCKILDGNGLSSLSGGAFDGLTALLSL